MSKAQRLSIVFRVDGESRLPRGTWFPFAHEFLDLRSAREWAACRLSPDWRVLSISAVALSPDWRVLSISAVAV